jgi:MoaA/NifB/PqqE/SkfB family radical SAM enzyme
MRVMQQVAPGQSCQPGRGKKEAMTATETTGTATPQVPDFLELEVTGICQIRCIHCYADSGPQGGHGTMISADWERVIDQAAALGVRTVQFIGGEPLIAPQLPRLVRHALKAGLNVNVYSNLVRVTPALFDLLASPRLSLSTSWYTADPAAHEQITGSKTAWASTRANIAEAVRRGIPVRAAIIGGIVPGQDLIAAEADLRALGVADIRGRSVQGAGRAAAGRHENDPSELCGHCGIGRAAVLPDGQLTPCVIARWMHTGNVRKTPIGEILAGQAWRDALASVPRMADPYAAECPPASDGDDCPPASQPACAPSYCAPDTGDIVSRPIPLARVTAGRAG